MITALIVDDSEPLRKKLRDSLSRVRSDIEVSEASTGKEALAIYNARKHDFVILDISLPDISGIDILKEIKLTGTSTRVIIFTNYPSPEFKEGCLALGADFFFDKCNDFVYVIDLFKGGTLNSNYHNQS